MRLAQIVIVLCLTVAESALAQQAPIILNYVKERQESACETSRRAEVSARLEAIRAIDQSSRQSVMTDSAQAVRLDLENRKEVAMLFAEGCFTTGRDYHNAALVFQHGDVPDHFYQTYIWASRAVELGDLQARWLIPRAVDRWALNSGYKQLFATNLVTESYFSQVTEESQKAWCLWPNTSRITDRQRRAFGLKTLAEQVARAKAMNTGSSTGICAIQLPDPPRGLFPGVW